MHKVNDILSAMYYIIINEAKSCYSRIRLKEHTIKRKLTIKRYYQGEHPF